MIDYVEEFIKLGGEIKQFPPGNSLRENDGMTPQQIDQQKWAVRMEKKTANEQQA